MSDLIEAKSVSYSVDPDPAKQTAAEKEAIRNAAQRTEYSSREIRRMAAEPVTGNLSGVCPECGTAVTPGASNSLPREAA